MLKKDDILKNSILKDLTPEQITAIETLSENDESAIIAEKTRRFAEGLEDDIRSVTGLEKAGGEKYFDFMKRALTEYKEKAANAGNSEETEKLKAQLVELQEKVKSGAGDEAIKKQLEEATKQLTDSKSRIGQLETDLNKKSEELQNIEKENNTKFSQLEIKTDLNGWFADKKPKTGIDENLFNELREKRLNDFLATVSKEVITGEDGKKIVQFRDKNGEVLTNPEDLRRPHTLESLASKTFGDLLHRDKEQTGTGTKGTKPAAINTIEGIRSAPNQLAADEVIKQHLNTIGISTADPTYQEKYNAIRAENEVSKLPAGYGQNV